MSRKVPQVRIYLLSYFLFHIFFTASLRPYLVGGFREGKKRKAKRQGNYFPNVIIRS